MEKDKAQKILVFARHAEPDGRGDDPSLSQDGRKQAIKSAQDFKENFNCTVDLMFSSSAQRARSTMAFYKKTLNAQCDTVIDTRLSYAKGKVEKFFIDRIFSQGSDIKTIMIFSHDSTIDSYTETLGLGRIRLKCAQYIALDYGLNDSWENALTKTKPKLSISRTFPTAYDIRLQRKREAFERRQKEQGRGPKFDR